jgi:hypothetical protein
MSLQQFPSDDSLRTQRMTADEAKSVIDLWQQECVEHTGLTDRPTVPDVAEGLDIGVEDVHRLLAEVRTQRLEEEGQLAEIQRQRIESGRVRANVDQQYRQTLPVDFLPQPWLPQIDLDDFLRGFLPGFIAVAVVLIIAVLLTILSQHSSP